MGYTVVIEDTLTKLVRAVEKKLGEGWKPQGGIFINLNKGGNPLYCNLYVQAMYKENENE